VTVWRWTLVWIASVAAGLVGCSGPSPRVEGTKGELAGRESPTGPSWARGAAEFGIRDLQLRLTNHGYLIDFRYTVEDERLAAPLLDREVPMILHDPVTDGHYQVIGSPKVGPLRNTGVPEKGRRYYVLFANPGAKIPAGRTLEVEVGDRVIPGLLLE